MGEISKVTDPSKIVTDAVLLSVLARQGIDKDYVEFYQDYAPRSLGREHSPYAKFYRDLKSNRRFMVVSGLPMVRPDGDKIEVGWVESGNEYLSKLNLFSATVKESRVTLACLYDQPTGAKAGDDVSYGPQLFLDEHEILPVSAQPILLNIDPVNANYSQNVLEWDYGICKRRLRLLEGRIHGYWVFDQNPSGEVRIRYNQAGNYKLKLGEFKINDDEELIPAEVFDKAGYPFQIGDSATFYPDANPETTSVDGRTSCYTGSDLTWAQAHDSGGAFAVDNDADAWCIVLYTSANSNYWLSLGRSIFLFDTSSLPDEATISAATLSVMTGSGKNDPAGWAPDVNVYSSAPASNTAVVAGDFDSLGTTPFSTAITYANWAATGNYNDFALNSDGLSAISKTGVSKFGLRNANYDVANSAPTWSASKTANLDVYYAEKGTGYKPKLVVTYTTVTEKTSSDAGSGVESLISRLFSIVETGSGTESVVSRWLEATENGLGSELGGLLKTIFGSDEGGGLDSLKALIETAGSDMRLPDHPGQVRMPYKGVNL